ncbi:TPR/MLP1/MLP2-like protein-domain-containing protein [Phakopsora pachyrhizi]|uniref:TPR/MLP1/MLP2-like protein-domain-containing protein n=1 Tax=Phakopsora pachyrhizi TaxID=170000 RepID=A0AAV0B2U7_PHAPC|nr:TPR/MLP1/MLP2-like protein-domain-containing protein [Phakopsora pachyrhizi]
MDKRDKQRAKRMEQYEQEWNVRRAELDQREKEMNEILDNERRRIAELEQKLDDTTSALSRVCGSENETNGRWEDSEFTRNSSFMSLAPDTPLAGRQNVAVFTNGLSPAAAMASKIQKSGKSLTEIYTEKIVLEEQMKKVKLENVRLSETMSQILAEIEDRAPLLHQQRLEHDRLERECDELTTQLTSSIEEKEEAERKYHSCQLDLDATRRDLELSNSQLRDLSLQIRVLTQENVLRGSGNSSQTIKGDEDDLMADVSDWRQPLDGDDEDVLIANDLITFKSIAELQQKNLKLLFLARKLTSKIQEIEESKDDEDEDQDEATSKAIDEAHELILKLKSQLQSSQHKCEALSRERDMLRRLANQRGDHHIEASSTQLEEGLRIGSQQSVEDLDAQFKAYRVEMGVDTKKLNEDLNRSRAELSQTQVLLAKSNAQIECLNERHKALGQTNSMHAQEMQSLTASNVKLQEHIAKNETLLHQANESVIEMKNKCHFLQHQVETLTMEREVWKGVEGRLTAENSSLTRERNNINDILRNVQSMQGDIERTNLESRRRLESQINKMEIQIQDFKEKIKVESEAARQSNLQREIAVADYQQKLDKLTNEHLLSRENLSAASVAKEHLEAQVSDLQKQVAIKEERLRVYEGHRRPAALDNGIEVNLAADPSQSGEQRLQIEVADLKIELMAAKEDASRAKEHIEQFKAISQSAEAALASLTATHDEYKSAQEAELNQKQNALSSLEEHLKRLTQDLSAATTQNSELHRQIESQRAEFEKEKSSLMSRLKELEEVEEVVKTREAELREEVNQHFRSAQESHDRYQAEVQNHAKSLFELKTVKEELEKAQEKITVAQSAAELATTKLNSSQSSWSDQKVVFQREITNVQARCDDLVKQNNLLHEHLETMSAQAAKISNQAIDSIAGSTCSGGEIGVQNDFNENATESIEQLRGVIHYLRNNHDIAQHQIELSKLEVTRLQQQLQHVSKALDQTRVELNHEREKSRQGYVSSAEHSQLLDQINTLNMVRESNVTLREEAQRSERKAKQLEDRLKEMAETLEPLKKELSELKLTVQHYKQEIAILNEDNERWKARNQMILEKYDRIDPAEVQGLRDEITKLKQDLTQTKEELTSTHHFREKFKLIQTQARSQRQKHTDEISALNEELSKVKETMRDKEKDAQNSQDQVLYIFFVKKKTIINFHVIYI